MASSTQDQRDESEEERDEEVGELPRLRPLPSRRVATDTPSPTSGMAGRSRTLPAAPPTVDEPSSVADVFDDANVNRPGGGDRFEEEPNNITLRSRSPATGQFGFSVDPGNTAWNASTQGTRGEPGPSVAPVSEVQEHSSETARLAIHRERHSGATQSVSGQRVSNFGGFERDRPGEKEFQHVADDRFPRRTADQLLAPSGPERGPPDATNQLSAFRPIEAQATVLPIGEPSRLGWKERRPPQGALPSSLLPAETSQRSHTYPVSMQHEQPAEFIQPRREGYMSSYPPLPAAGSAPFAQSETTVGQPSLREGARIPAQPQTWRRPPAVPAAAAPYDGVPAQLRSAIAQAPARMPEVSNGRSEDQV